MKIVGVFNEVVIKGSCLLVSSVILCISTILDIRKIRNRDERYHISYIEVNIMEKELRVEWECEPDIVFITKQLIELSNKIKMSENKKASK
ncbi:hypothetical protein D0U04_07070 [Bacillus clarus]|uniref:Lipoprotein n=1 Tax=Bacillus clarus TaxID=2338372 RepID=A0ABX9KXV6_9BACI|nr:hypothetical protein D0U04_07070 [Bacillus clarus]